MGRLLVDLFGYFELVAVHFSTHLADEVLIVEISLGFEYLS